MTWHIKHGRHMWIHCEVQIQANVDATNWRRVAKKFRAALPDGWDSIKKPEYINLRCFDLGHFPNLTEQKLGELIALLNIAVVFKEYTR